MIFSKRRTGIALAGALALMGAAAHAQSPPTAPSCYTVVGVPRPPQASATALFVLIDQTVLLDDGLKRSLVENAAGLLRPNSEYEVIQFSAFSQGRYLQSLTQGVIDPLLSTQARNSVGVRTLARLDACTQGQGAYAKTQVYGAIKRATDGASASLARSDILASLKEVSRAVARSSAKRKIVLIASDMLENSSISSFYAKNKMRPVNPQQEIDKARAAGMIGDFAGADVFVIGAGLMGDANTAYGPNGSAATYRDPVAMQGLKHFWIDYFAASHATLADFGAPALLRPIN